MRNLPRRLTPITLASLLALGACASPGPDAEFDEPGSSSSDTATQPDEAADGADEAEGSEAPEGTEKPEDTEKPEKAEKDPSAYTVRHTNDYKTIITLDRGEVEALTGADLDGGVDDAQQALSQPATWSGGDTEGHADVIVEAADRESDRIDRVLGQQADGRDVELRLFIKHNGHVHVAHFGEDDDD